MEMPDEINIGGMPIHGSYTEENIRLTTEFISRDGDIFLVTYPRSGTTWTQNILLGIKKGVSYLDFKDGKQLSALSQEFPYLEMPFPKPGYEIADEIDDLPRLMKTHLPSNLAPKEILSHKRKCIVVIRNPKDAALSLRKFYQNNVAQLVKFNKFKDLEDFLEHFLEGKVIYASWWRWNKAWIDIARSHDNIHLMHYEDLRDNFESEVQKLTAFLGWDSLTDDQMSQLKHSVSVDQMKIRYAYPTLVKDFIGNGNQRAWETEMPPDFAKRFDDMTRTIFAEDPVLAKLL